MQLTFLTYQTAADITPSDTADQSYRAIYVGGAGNVSVVTAGGNTVTFTAPPVGTIIPIDVTRVRSTGTTATLLLGLA